MTADEIVDYIILISLLILAHIYNRYYMVFGAYESQLDR